MKKSISRIIGVIMLIVAFVFIMFALNHPEKSFPWNNTITWLLYACRSGADFVRSDACGRHCAARAAEKARRRAAAHRRDRPARLRGSAGAVSGGSGAAGAGRALKNEKIS